VVNAEAVPEKKRDIRIRSAIHARNDFDKYFIAMGNVFRGRARQTGKYSLKKKGIMRRGDFDARYRNQQYGWNTTKELWQDHDGKITKLSSARAT
jgi:hypothetical protein